MNLVRGFAIATFVVALAGCGVAAAADEEIDGDGGNSQAREPKDTRDAGGVAPDARVVQRHRAHARTRRDPRRVHAAMRAAHGDRAARLGAQLGDGIGDGDAFHGEILTGLTCAPACIKVISY